MASVVGATLSEQHLAELRASAITDEQIEARGYETITNPRALRPALTGPMRVPGLLIPIRNTQGENVAWQLKPDTEWRDKAGKPAKYLTAGRTCLDVPEAARPYLLDPEAVLWITEGCKKVDSAVSHGIPCTIGVQGVWMWRQDGVALPDWDDITLKGRTCILAFDSDVMAKDSVRGALERLARYLEHRGSSVRYCLMPDLPGGSKCGLDDWFAAGHTRAGLEALIVDTLPGAEPEWEEPLPLDDPAGPPFPIDALPGVIGQFVGAVAVATQTPPGLAAVLALGTLSAAVRGRYVVSIPEHSWQEPVLIQTVAFAGSGERKSAVVRELTAPLASWEREKHLEDESQIQEWESRFRVLKKQLDSAEAAASKGRAPGASGPDPLDLDRQRQAAALELAEHVKKAMQPTRIVVHDITSEMAKQMIVEQGGALAVVEAEGTFFAILAGRYSDPKKSPPLEVMLTGHAGEPVTVDRKTGPALYTPRGHLTIAVACQPHIAETLGGTDGFRDRGGAARILPAFLASHVGNRDITSPAIPEDLLAAWNTGIRAILDHNPVRAADSGGYPTYAQLHLSQGAYTTFQAFRRWHEPQLRQSGNMGDFPDWGSKLPGAVLRLAALLHIATHERPEHVAISVASIEQAIALAGFFTEHARIMYRVMAGRSGQAAARQVLEALHRLAGAGGAVSRRDLHRALRGRREFELAKDLDGPLRLLEEYGWIHRTREQGDGPGRPSEIITLNPYGQWDKMDKTPETANSVHFVPLSIYQRAEESEAESDTADLAPTGTDGAYAEDI